MSALAEFVVAIVEGVGEVLGIVVAENEGEKSGAIRAAQWVYAMILVLAVFAVVLAWINSG